MDKKGKYAKLGVSHGKEDVHAAISNIDKGLYPDAFCKILPDISGDPDYCSIFHSDSAGTKSSLAYMMYKETGDKKYFRGIVRDAIVMNTDDVLCVGVTGNALISDTIGRNKNIIDGSVISILIDEHVKFTEYLTKLGFQIGLAGGETEDIGDLIRTLEVGVSLFSRIRRDQIISGNDVKSGDVIVGLASSGSCKYDAEYNSGIGSNGLTLARHGSLDHKYYEKYPECHDPYIKEELTFFGKHDLLDPLPGTNISIGEALLSPTRTYAPIIIKILNDNKLRYNIHSIFHNTGGGQTKCLHFGKGRRYIKDNLMEIPPVFKMIQDSSETDWREMYQVFNMGHRMEIILPEDFAKDVIQIAGSFGVDARIVGHIENADNKNRNELLVSSAVGDFNYN